MTQKQVIQQMKTGDFTIAYHDNACAEFYKGKYEYDNLPEKEDYAFNANHDGYLPEVVILFITSIRWSNRNNITH